MTASSLIASGEVVAIPAQKSRILLFNIQLHSFINYQTSSSLAEEIPHVIREYEHLQGTSFLLSLFCVYHSELLDGQYHEHHTLKPCSPVQVSLK